MEQLLRHDWMGIQQHESGMRKRPVGGFYLAAGLKPKRTQNTRSSRSQSHYKMAFHDTRDALSLLPPGTGFGEL
jgi:hypothetical protein